MRKFSKKAKTHLDAAGTDAAREDRDAINAMIDELLTKPEASAWHDPELFSTHGIAYSHPYALGGPEYLLDAVNMESALEEFQDAGAEATRATFNHWTYHYFDCLKIRLITDHGKISLGAVILWEQLQRLESYPLLDEEAYFNAESALAEKYQIQEIDALDVTPEVKAQIYNALLYDGITLGDLTYGETELISCLERVEAMNADPCFTWGVDSWAEALNYESQIDDRDLTGLMNGRYN